MEMIKEALFKQTWWVSLAVVLAVLQAVVGIGIGLDSEATGLERFVFLAVWGVGAAFILLGAQRRIRNRGQGDALLVVGVLPSVAIGIIAFWFPPMWLVTGAGLVVMVKAIGDALNPASVAVAQNAN